MQVECPNCHKAYTIPGVRLLWRRKGAFRCPNCKAPVPFDWSRNRNKTASAPDGAEAPAEGGAPTGNFLKDRIVRSVRDLPPMPQIVDEARRIMADPNSSFGDLAKLFETDQAIAARVLKLANSAYYGISGQVASIQHAAVVLGQKALGELLTLASASALLSRKLTGYRLAAGDLWHHSLAVASGARAVARMRRPELAEDAFAAGLIHDAGKLILDGYVKQEEAAFGEFLKDSQRMWLDAEREILGFDHSEIAADVCERWKIPAHLATAIRFHHFPSQAEDSDLAYVVHLADATAMMIGIGTGLDGMRYRLDSTAMPFLGIHDEHLSNVMSEAIDFTTRTTQDASPA
ncbi:MAG: zinc-ribbon domain-containing protein [Kiritimatiellae bacterium]|nr:zinc-ribbon domain-containing protein [Kiritimatiellia bacterium]